MWDFLLAVALLWGVPTLATLYIIAAVRREMGARQRAREYEAELRERWRKIMGITK